MKNNSWAYKIPVFITITAVMSLYLFPVVFSFFRAANSKMILAGLGLVWFLFDLATKRERKGELSKSLFFCSIAAALVSLAGFASIIVNGTFDTAYASYIVSMWVWLGGAYFCIRCIQAAYGEIKSNTVAHYIIAACTFQCVSAIFIQFFPPVDALVSTLISDFAGVDSLDNIKGMERLYGVGAALDPAGCRFSTAIIILGYLLILPKENDKNWVIPVYLVCLFILLIIGNMIARTTTIGFLAAIILWIFNALFSRKKCNRRLLFSWATAILCISIVLSVYLYNHNRIFHNDIRFAFEGFFSLVEDGYWHTNSNDNLANMYVFPDNIRTWIIGDGFFGKPDDATGPLFLGDNPTAFYMGTDVGYCRFIFYFGVIGLILFSFFIISAGYFCGVRNKDYKPLFFFIVCLNFVLWLKVSTDLFLIFALFLCVPESEESTDEEPQIKPL